MQEFITTSLLATGTTVVVAAGKNAKVHSILIPKTTTGTVVVSNTSAAGAVNFPASTIAGSYIVDATYANGLLVVCSATDSVVLSYVPF